MKNCPCEYCAAGDGHHARQISFRFYSEGTRWRRLSCRGCGVAVRVETKKTGRPRKHAICNQCVAVRKNARGPATKLYACGDCGRLNPRSRLCAKCAEQTTRWQSISRSARARDIPLLITKRQFQLLVWLRRCFWCSAEFKALGLDRLNNDRGYEIGNVVPCCHECNSTRTTANAAAYLPCARYIDGRWSDHPVVPPVPVEERSRFRALLLMHLIATGVYPEDMASMLMQALGMDRDKYVVPAMGDAVDGPRDTKVM